MAERVNTKEKRKQKAILEAGEPDKHDKPDTPVTGQTKAVVRFVERCPRGMCITTRKEQYSIYKAAAGVNARFSLTGLILWYRESQFSTSDNDMWTFCLIRPVDMPIPWLNMLEKKFASVLDRQAEFSGRARIALAPKIELRVKNSVEYLMASFTHDGPVTVVSLDYTRGKAVAEDLPNYTPIRLDGYLHDSVKPRADRVALGWSVTGVRIIKTPPYLAEFQRQMVSGPPPSFPPDELEEPDGDAYPMQEDLESLFLPSDVQRTVKLMDGFLQHHEE